MTIQTPADFAKFIESLKVKNEGPEERNWPEDASHGNGNYQNKCVGCGEVFIGHKRRIICRVCADGGACIDKARIDHAHRLLNNSLDYLKLGPVAELLRDYEKKLARAEQNRIPETLAEDVKAYMRAAMDAEQQRRGSFGESAVEFRKLCEEAKP